MKKLLLLGAAVLLVGACRNEGNDKALGIDRDQAGQAQDPAQYPVRQGHTDDDKATGSDYGPGMGMGAKPQGADQGQGMGQSGQSGQQGNQDSMGGQGKFGNQGNQGQQGTGIHGGDAAGNMQGAPGGAGTNPNSASPHGGVGTHGTNTDSGAHGGTQGTQKR
jgi:hypothetical protein